MKLYLQGHDYQYAVEQIMLVLFPEERPEYAETPFEGEENACRSVLTMGNGTASAETSIRHGGRTVCAAAQIPAPDAADPLVYDRLL